MCEKFGWAKNRQQNLKQAKRVFKINNKKILFFLCENKFIKFFLIKRWKRLRNENKVRQSK